MKKLIAFLTIAFAACSVFAAEAAPASAKQENLAGKRYVWYRLSTTGKMQRQANGSIFLTLATPKSPWADAGYAKKITVKPGEKLVITMEAQGTGTMDYGIRMDKAGNLTKAAKLSGEFQKFTASFDFAKIQKDLPQQGMLKIILRGGTPDAKAEVRSFTFSLTK